MTARPTEGEHTVQLGQYARAVVLRWAWVALGALAGGVLGAVVSALGSNTYSSSVSLHVGAATVDGHQDLAYATLVGDRVVPSVEALATSGVVLQDVADRVGLPGGAADLGARVTVTSGATGDLFTVSVTDPQPTRAAATARALGDVLTRQAGQLLSGDTGPLVDVHVLGPPSPAEESVRSTARHATEGAAAGAALAALTAGLVELARPRIRGGRDASSATGLPAVALPALPRHRRLRRALARSRSAQPADLARAGRLTRLAALLPEGTTDRAVVLLGAGTVARAAHLAAELRGALGTGTGPRLLPLEDPRDLPAVGPVAGVLLVTDARGTTRARLQDALAAVTAAGAPPLGVAVDGLVPPGAGARTRLGAGLRGDATWAGELRDAVLDGAPATPGTGPRLVALLAVAALGFTRLLPFTLTAGLVAALALLPVWAPVVRRHRACTALVSLGVLSVVAGVLLHWLHSTDHGFAMHEAGATGSLVLTSVLGVPLLLWARTQLPTWLVAAAYGVGNLVAEVPLVHGSPNAWKFVLSFPVAVIVLALVARRGRTVPAVVALAVLAVVDVLNDYRSALGFCVVSAVLALVQRRVAAGHRIRGRVALPLLAASGLGMYWLLERLLVSGLLGAHLKARSTAQIAQSGSLLLGGRPEWAGTWALMQDSPWGFGLGTVPDAHDVAVAEAGLSVTHVPTVDAYAQHYMFNGGYEVHSIAGDLWVAAGVPGLALALLMGGLAVAGLLAALGARRASALACFLVPMGLWDLAFGPASDNLPTLVLALGLLVPRRPAVPRNPAPVGARPPARPRSVLVEAS